jgi:hypothetical protein
MATQMPKFAFCLSEASAFNLSIRQLRAGPYLFTFFMTNFCSLKKGMRGREAAEQPLVSCKNALHVCRNFIGHGQL